LRAAAVALALLPDADGAPALRADAPRREAQGAPGPVGAAGRPIDAGESPSDAALRELREEVGLEIDGGAVLGLLDDYPTRSGYCITPVVVWAGADAELAPNPDEGRGRLSVALSELDRPDVPRLRTIPESDRP
jgi:8-oxo-dGTP pyrophosphatase MutT (NUDIX family)